MSAQCSAFVDTVCSFQSFLLKNRRVCAGLNRLQCALLAISLREEFLKILVSGFIDVVLNNCFSFVCLFLFLAPQTQINIDNSGEKISELFIKVSFSLHIIGCTGLLFDNQHIFK